MSSRPVLGCKDAMDFGPKETVTTRQGDCLMLCIYNASTVSTNADFHVLREIAERIHYHVIALQETKSRKTDVRQLSVSQSSLVVRKFHHGTLEALDLSYTHLFSILSIRMRSYHLAWLSFDSVLCVTNTIINCYPPTSAANDFKLDAFYEIGESHRQRKLLLLFRRG
ncbi:unnamed protein product [Strongylus vulgaris]|uniref:Endonuclease/exonuclease/phosphatase domain-containing protein n=1 Tax=Strongylus vulgaris TaxID=40348 RepID=A0A3P7JG70_STRVU|nr:unnamed protein product [Strongylus vulgaris]